MIEYAEQRPFVDRRVFLKSALSVGVLTAVSRLPALADDSSVFPKRGRFERLNINEVHIDAGATNPFSVLHISDTHLTDAYPDEDSWKQQLKERSTVNFGGLQEEALRSSVVWAKAHCDYLLHTGDVIDWHSRKNLDLVKKYLGEGTFGAIGNHEYTLYHYLTEQAGAKNDIAAIRKILEPIYPFRIEFDAHIINGVDFVSMDDVFGRVTAKQVRLFKEEVAKGLPIILLKHVPFYTDFIWTVTDKYWGAETRKYRSSSVPVRRGEAYVQRTDPLTRDFIAYLKTVTSLKAVLAGHEHLTVQDRFSPTAMEYVVGGNYLFAAQEVLVS